jgi:hypothetical protein
MTGPLGRKVVPPAPPPAPEWKPHPDNPQLEVNRSGQLRTRIPPPAQQVWPFPMTPKGTP